MKSERHEEKFAEIIIGRVSPESESRVPKAITNTSLGITDRWHCLARFDDRGLFIFVSKDEPEEEIILKLAWLVPDSHAKSPFIKYHLLYQRKEGPPVERIDLVRASLAYNGFAVVGSEEILKQALGECRAEFYKYLDSMGIDYEEKNPR